MTDDDLLLATAYLDGELDAADRVRVERDPELLAAVDEQRQVRALVGDVEPPSISRREEHLAAALDAWDRIPAAAGAGDGTPAGVAAIATPPPSSAGRRRVDWNRRLLAAAAALVVVVGAGVALQTFTQIDGDDADSADEASDAAAAVVAEGDASTGETSGTRDSDDAEFAESAPAAADQSELATDGTIDVGSDNASPPREDDLEQLRGPDDLAIFATDALRATVADSAAGGDADEADEADGALAEIDLPLCLGADLLVGPARYRDQVVVVGIDEGRDLALAYLPDGCVEVARASVPAEQP